MRPLLLLILLCFPFVGAFAQQTLFSMHLKESEGYSVFSVEKDRHGFLWYSTKKGVYRYDGSSTKYYRLLDTDFLTQDDGLTNYLYMNAGGHMWSFSENGNLYLYDENNDRFSLFYRLLHSNPQLRLYGLSSDDDGDLWCSTSDGIYVVRPDADPVVQENIFPEECVNSVCMISDTLTVVSTKNGIFFIDPCTYEQTGDRLFPGEEVILTRYDKARNWLWIGFMSSGVRIYDMTSGSILENTALTVASPIRAFEPVDQDHMLIGTDGMGVYEYDMADRSFSLVFSEDPASGSLLKGNGVYDILADGRNVWVATYTGGLSRIDLSGKYLMYRSENYNVNSLANPYVKSVLEDRDGDLWFATNAGISIYFVKKGEWKHVVRDGMAYLTMVEDRKGRVWCGGYAVGIAVVDKYRGVVKRICSLENSGQPDCIFASYRDDNGNLWFGGLFNCLTCVNDSGEILSTYDIRPVNSIERYASGSIIINTSYGFYLVNDYLGTVEHHMINEKDYGLKSNKFIYTSVVDGDEVWLGTYGGGLSYINMKTGESGTFSIADGLPSNFIHKIIHDTRTGLLWVSTDKGIFSFDPEIKKICFKLKSLPVSNFVYSSGFSLKDGRIAFGSVDGCLIFDPANMKKDKLSPNLRFTDFNLFYEPVSSASEPDILEGNINAVGKISLKHDQNTFSFAFSAADLYFSDNYTYEHILQGYDHGWIHDGNSRKADYTNVPPGKYKFIVNCINADDRNILATRSVDVRIRPSIWLTAFAKLIYCLLALSSVAFVYLFFRRRQEQRDLDDRLSFFINIAHDIRTPLSLIVSPLEEMSKAGELTPQTRYLLSTARNNTAKLMGLVQELMTFQQMDMKMESVPGLPVNISEFVRKKYSEFEQMALNKNLEFGTDLPKDDVFGIVAVDKVSHIIENLLSNSIKYTAPGGRVVLRFCMADDRTLVFEISDTGIGIPASVQKNIFRKMFRDPKAMSTGEIGSGLGLVVTNRLVRRLGGSISFESREGEGSVFKVRIPFERKPETRHEISTADEILSGNQDSPENGSRKNRLMIVEDNPEMLNYLSCTLASDYTVFEMSSAESALQFLKRTHVDIIISDVSMPGMNGIDFCRLVKTNIETSHIFVILLTAVSFESKVIQGLESGADDYITKPFNIDALRFKLVNILQMRNRIWQYSMRLRHMPDVPSAELPDMAGEINSLDQNFVEKCIDSVILNMSDSKYGVVNLCRDVAMSRTLLYEKLKAITGKSPSDFIREIKMQRAKDLLLSGHSVSDVSEMVGFSDPKYFSTVFNKVFGETPSSVRQSSGKNQK